MVTQMTDATPPCAPKVQITLPVLQEINAFSNLQLTQAHVATTSCFSNPMLEIFCCNPSDELAKGKPESQDFCAIHWICKVNLAARLGIGLPQGSTYDFEKSKQYVMKLSYPNLVKALRAKLEGKELSVDPLAESILEAKKEDAESLQATQEPAKVSEPKVKAPSIASAAAPKVKTEPTTAPKALPVGDGSVYAPGSMGHFILSQLTKDVAKPIDEVWKAVEAKGWKSKARFDKQLQQLTDEKRVVVQDAGVSLS
jgi:hypothetical protein